MIQNSLHLLFTINFDPSFGPSHYHLWKSITAQTKIATTMNSTPIMLIISFYYKKTDRQLSVCLESTGGLDDFFVLVIQCYKRFDYFLNCSSYKHLRVQVPKPLRCQKRVFFNILNEVKISWAGFS